MTMLDFSWRFFVSCCWFSIAYKAIPILWNSDGYLAISISIAIVVSVFSVWDREV